MRKLVLVTFLSSLSVQAMASCDALKQEIDAKIQAKGVTNYTLEIQPVEAAAAGSGVAATPKSGGKVVGTCDGGTKNIIYTRTAASAAPAKAPAAPAAAPAAKAPAAAASAVAPKAPAAAK